MSESIPSGKIEITCMHCGTKCLRFPSAVRAAKRHFCSQACHSAWLLGNDRGPSALDRFMAKVQKQDNGCWKWMATKNQKGYGRIGVGQRMVLAHRFAYEHFREAIPEGMVLDHLCRNPWCVNPDHLEVVDGRTNTLRGESRGAVCYRAGTCQRGHAYAEHAYYRDGKRICCRTCENENRRRRQRAA